MNTNHPRLIRGLAMTAAVLAIGSVIAYAAVVEFRQDAYNAYIGLRGGPAQVTARVLRTPVGEVTGGWHYHPGYVYNVVMQGTITIEDGCGQIRHSSKGQAFETSEGRVRRAYNLGSGGRHRVQHVRRPARQAHRRQHSQQRAPLRAAEPR